MNARKTKPEPFKLPYMTPDQTAAFIEALPEVGTRFMDDARELRERAEAHDAERDALAEKALGLRVMIDGGSLWTEDELKAAARIATTDPESPGVTDEEWRALAACEWGDESGAIEIDDDAKTSPSERGACVQAWVWVDAPDADELDADEVAEERRQYAKANEPTEDEHA